MKKFLVVATSIICLGAAVLGASQSEFSYRTPEETNSSITKIKSQNASAASLINLGKSFGGRDLVMLNLGKKDSQLPAVMVIANMSGDYPLATEAAVRLAEKLVTEWKTELESHRWYILPVGNPDGYARFFATPRNINYGNERPVNDDNDDATDEDGPEDLNRDGYITTMRQKHPEGKWITLEGNPILMREASVDKGEVGIYRLFTEGLDNDGDGEIDEDGPGGVNPGHNFPHRFKHYTTTDGRWATSEPESHAVLRFSFDHPEIAMIIVLGRTNSLLNVPEGAKDKSGFKERYRPRGWMAEEAKLDPSKEYPLDVLVEVLREAFGNPNLTPEKIVQWISGEAALLPDDKDLKYWKEIGERYRKFMGQSGLDVERLSPPEFPPGSIDEWAYYQYGVPAFSLDFWTVPKPKVDSASAEAEASKGEKQPDPHSQPSGKEKIDGGTDEGAGQTQKLLYQHNPAAFMAWQKFNHPTLGEVEIGGMLPYADILPPPQSVSELIDKQLPFLKELAGLIPHIDIEKVETKKISQGVWKIDVWIINRGFLPYPTYQGQRCYRPTNVIAVLEGVTDADFLEGRSRQILELLEGSGGTQKVSWKVTAEPGHELSIKAMTASAGETIKKITLR